MKTLRIFAALLAAAVWTAIAIVGGAFWWKTYMGFELTEGDVQECHAHGCQAWTKEQLQSLAQQAFAAGYKRGRGEL